MAPRKPQHSGARLIDVSEEDLSFAVRSDQYNCAIVRSIQRKIPDALFVRVNQDAISFTMPNDKLAGEEERGVRYKFKTPKEAVDNIIRPLDQGEKVEPFSFILPDAIEVKPMQHHKIGSDKDRRYHRLYDQDRKRRRQSQNPNVATYKRFLNVVAEEGASDDGS